MVKINSFIDIGYDFKSVDLHHRRYGAIALAGNKNKIVNGKTRTPAFMSECVGANANVYKMIRNGEAGELFRIEICDNSIPRFTKTKIIVPLQYANFNIDNYSQYETSFTRNLNVNFRVGKLVVFFSKKSQRLPMSYDTYLRQGELFTNDLKKVITKAKKFGMDLDKFVFTHTTGEELHFEYNLH